MHPILTIASVLFLFCLTASAEQNYFISPASNQLVLPGQSLHFSASYRWPDRYCHWAYTWYVNGQWAGGDSTLVLHPGYANNSAINCYMYCSYSHTYHSGTTDTVYITIISAPFAIQSNFSVQLTNLAPNMPQYSKLLSWNAAQSEDVILPLFPGQIWSVDFLALVGGHHLQYHWNQYINGVDYPIGFTTPYIQSTFNPTLNGSSYQLTVSNPAGFISLPRLITILAIPTPINMPTDIYAITGDEIHLKVEFYPETTPSIFFWELNEKQISINITDFNIIAHLELDQARLTLVATNLAGTTRTFITIHVEMSSWIIVAIIGSASTLIIIIVLAALIYKGVLRFPKKENLTECEVTPYPVPKVEVSTEATCESGQSFDFGTADSSTVGIPLDDADKGGDQ